MPTGIGTALLIGGLTSAGVSAASAIKQSSAAKAAAKTQTAAVDKAQAFNREAFDAQQRALAPYQQAGQSALGSLMSRYGTSDPALAAQRSNAFVNAAQQRSAAQGFPVPQGAQMPPQGAPASGPNGLQQAMGGDMVRMVGPDGSAAMIPRQNVQTALQRGARVA